MVEEEPSLHCIVILHVAGVELVGALASTRFPTSPSSVMAPIILPDFFVGLPVSGS
jgi:hypothetical protein